MRHTATRAPRFDREWKEMIAFLPEHRQTTMETAIKDYQLSGIMPEGLDGTEMMAFLLIKKIVDRRAKQRRARLSKKASENSVHETESLPQSKLSNQTSIEVQEPVVAQSIPIHQQKILTKAEKRKAIIRHLNRMSAKRVRS